MMDQPETRNASASVRRALTILDYLSAHMDEGGLTLAGLARGTQIHKSTLLRLLDALHEFNLVEKDPVTEHYRLGLKVLQLASSYLDNMELRSVAAPFLQQLMVASGETVHLAVMEDYQAVYIDKVEGPGNVRLVSRIGGHNPLYCTAMGKALLASLPETIFDEVVRRGLAPHTNNTLATRQTLQEDLTRICSRGYSIDNEENELGVRCVGAALFDHKGYPIAAISVSGPTMRVTWDHVDQLGQLVKQTAEKISQHLGYPSQTRT
jgi:DNA-binding IclR family transcriptional regulator